MKLIIWEYVAQSIQRMRSNFLLKSRSIIWSLRKYIHEDVSSIRLTVPSQAERQYFEMIRNKQHLGEIKDSHFDKSVS